MKQGIGEEREGEVEGVPEDVEGATRDGMGAAPAPTAPAEPETDYKDRWLRAEADLQNLRRRATRDVIEASRRSEEAVLLDVIAWLDDLERAIDAARSGGAPPSWVEGVALVLQKGREYLQRLGVTEVGAVGEPFDPAHHEAILAVDAPEGTSPGSVAQVVQKGYRRQERSLRAARVAVARAAEDRS